MPGCRTTSKGGGNDHSLLVPTVTPNISAVPVFSKFFYANVFIKLLRSLSIPNTVGHKKETHPSWYQNSPEGGDCPSSGKHSKEPPGEKFRAKTA